MNSKNNSNKTSVDNVWQYAQLRMMVYANLLAACTDDELREKTKREQRYRGWTQERSYYLYALRDECERRGIFA